MEVAIICFIMQIILALWRRNSFLELYIVSILLKLDRLSAHTFATQKSKETPV